ncbi:hypothetical protein OC834_001319 [Tilletia horrida]|uniref:Uncharacterized protein n=1 Tax=Tilletia horrida TaxID=155126 RepID=A0AAN6JNV6_9BASI|nr:hypothetical protein OC834_001319 [Tilletia horrida]KAK0539075.1 hypothetical protein OC842_001092 [Tilletia horrida]KAK0557631.1 hypothetical protein OC844_005543 [Tilletia horrida]
MTAEDFAPEPVRERRPKTATSEDERRGDTGKTSEASSVSMPAPERSKPPQPSSYSSPKASSARRKDEFELANAKFLSGVLLPLKMLVLVPWSLRFYLFYALGIAFSILVLQNLLLTLLGRLRLPFSTPALSSLIPGPLASGLAKVDICSAPLASTWFPHCAQQERSQRELRRRLGLAESTEHAAKFTSGMVDLVSTTPQASYVQRVSNSAHTLSQAFRLRSTVPSAPHISRDLEKIGEETERMVDSVIEVEVQGRVAVGDMVAGNNELMSMLQQPSRYSADLVERRLNRLIDGTDAALEALQVQLVAAQRSAATVVALQRQLRGKLYADQSDLQELHVEDQEARSFLSALRRSFDLLPGQDAQESAAQRSKKPLSALESYRLQKNLDLLNVAVDDVQDWSNRFSEFSIYLRSYRSQVSARKRQLSQHQWTSADLTVEDRIKAIGRLLEPAQQRLAQIEKKADAAGANGRGAAEVREQRVGIDAGS